MSASSASLPCRSYSSGGPTRRSLRVTPSVSRTRHWASHTPSPRYLRLILPCCPIRSGGLPVIPDSHPHATTLSLAMIAESYSGRTAFVLGESLAFPVDYVAQPVADVFAELCIAGTRPFRCPLGWCLGRDAITVGKFLTAQPPILSVRVHSGHFPSGFPRVPNDTTVMPCMVLGLHYFPPTGS